MSEITARDAASADRFGRRTLAEIDDLLRRTIHMARHQTDGPVEGGATDLLDHGPNLGLVGPPLGGPFFHTVCLGPRRGSVALGDRDGEAEFGPSAGTLWGRRGHGWAHDG